MRGLCTDHDNPDMWFPEYPTTGRPSNKMRAKISESAIAAINICQACPTKTACLAEGMKPENIDNGIWGGTLPGERLLMSDIPVGKSTYRQDAVVFAERIRAWQEM